MTPRILLADDHPQVLTNLSRLAEEVGEVVGTMPDGRTVVAEALRLHPDVIVLDLAMPEVSGLDAARILRRDVPESKVIICTVHANTRMIEEAWAAGAVGVVRKQSAHADLTEAIRAVLAGGRFVSHALRDSGEISKPEDSARDSHEGGAP